MGVALTPAAMHAGTATAMPAPHSRRLAAASAAAVTPKHLAACIAQLKACATDKAACAAKNAACNSNQGGPAGGLAAAKGQLKNCTSDLATTKAQVGLGLGWAGLCVCTFP